MQIKLHVWRARTKYMEIKSLLRVAKAQLAESGISEVDAEHLLAHVLGLSRMDLHNSVLIESTLATISDLDVIEEQFFTLLDRRLNHEPLQYLTGVAPFRYLEIEVGPGVLVPRPESELLVEAVLQHIANLPAPVSVIDLGAGSGALSLAIATEAPSSRVIAVEKSPEALVWLKKNVSVIAENVRVVEGDVADVLPGLSAMLSLLIHHIFQIHKPCHEMWPALSLILPSLAGQLEWNFHASLFKLPPDC